MDKKERTFESPQNPFWNWSSGAAERVLHIDGTIAPESWYDDDVTPKLFREELDKGSGPVSVWLNSPGGDCIAASQIYTMLMEYPFDVTVKIDGIAASAASVIAMAGTKVLMAPTALMLIHNPATVAMGDHREMEKAIEMLDAVRESIVNAYEIKTGLSRKALIRMMEDETWFDAAKAIELGFADSLLNERREENVQASALLFSRRAADRALVNRIVSQIPVQPLYDRLERLKSEVAE